MILLDTNVVSELIRPKPDPGVEAWLAEQVAANVFLSVISAAELLYGVAILPSGQRRDRLTAEIEGMLRHDFAGRILPFDSDAARAYAVIAAERRAAGRPIGQFDGQIAAIARSRGAAIATRNAGDFAGCGIDVINPWHS
jgi:predicted nucleic acid-binding protein